MGAADNRGYLSHLVVVGWVAASTRNVAFNALLFLYQGLLGLKDVSTTLVYTHVLNSGERGVRSRLDSE